MEKAEEYKSKNGWHLAQLMTKKEETLVYSIATLVTVFNMMDSESSKQIDFSFPDSIRDFVFDLHDSTRRSFRLEDVTALYDKFKVLLLPTENS